ncbi:MAG: CHC2 zinc finger domain-containing protein [Patulibacter minatonensis]
MPRYAPDSRDRVRDAVDMVDLVQTRTELKRSGPGRYTGICCFHEERSPSLSVDADRKLYHCFGCQAGGDCFTFVQESEGTDFTGAIEYLAGRYGVTLEVLDDDPKKRAARKKEQDLLGLTERAAGFYERQLWTSPEAAHARDYLLGPRAHRGGAEGLPRRLGAGGLGPARRGVGEGRGWSPGCSRRRGSR